MTSRKKYFAIGFLCACVAFGASAQEAPLADNAYWIADEATGCLAANPSPGANESIRWSGACVNGLIEGEGVLTWYEGERLLGRDEGNFVAGKLSGRGKIESAEGWSYEGAFPGNGVMRFPDGEEFPAQAVGRNTGWFIQQTHETGL
jgi:hypothetical protein